MPSQATPNAVKTPSVQLEQLLAQMADQAWTIPGKTHLFYANREYTEILYETTSGKNQAVANSPYITVDQTPGWNWLEENAPKDTETREVLISEASRRFALATTGPCVALVYDSTNRSLTKEVIRMARSTSPAGMTSHWSPLRNCH